MPDVSRLQWLGQKHHAVDARRFRDAQFRRNPGQRQIAGQCAAAQARHRHGVPALLVVPAPDGSRQHCLPAGDPQAAHGRARKEGRCHAQAGSHRRPSQLSGGQQQRVAIARALVYEPRILLMDEPLGALDKKLREDLQDELRQLHRRLGITIVYVTHDQEEAMRLSQRIAIFSHGKIVGLGTGYDLYQNPPNAFVASFLGNSNFLKLKAQGNAVATFEGSSLSIRLTSSLKTDQDVLLMVRPEKAQALSVTQATATPLEAGWNEVSATVTEVLFLGESQTCSVVTTGGTAMTVKALSATGMPLKAGDPVRVRWAAADACIYTDWADSDLNKAAGAH
ncbi:Spermidine/putrescine ABC transporter ATP-binding protein [Pseudomonas syringae pv. ribicola]|uniref:Spermidine/putrescine ABC transporter ATP-binding protein n=1 Tax=Pseudomonas syringae pv. ribicola TaxID=55398 RepID=A0A3M2VPX3_PSESI|nr:Spermidine/putrescine ABC transporter ATP-binding protein [Pseudomonas syringae pv. ribicola]